MHGPRHLYLFAALACAGCVMPVARHSTSFRHQPDSRTAAAADKPAAPDLRRLQNGHYRVRNAWTVTLGGKRWTVQKGYTSNGITAPETIKRTLGDGVDHPETWAAVFHDWLFTQPGVTRSTADRLFHDLLLAYAVPREKADLMYASVSAYSMSKSLR